MQANRIASRAPARHSCCIHSHVAARPAPQRQVSGTPAATAATAVATATPAALLSSQQPQHKLLRAVKSHAVAGSAASTTADAAAAAQQKQRLLYEGIAFDMDGTLAHASIPFVEMRERTGIPVGDLFVAMESWEEPERIDAAMGVILEIEAEASKNIQAMEGLLELLTFLQDSDVKVALVTRNTTQSVDAFFNLVGQEWRQLFSEIRTREFKYVKPDKRLLLELAETWGIHPGKLLMVGDSHEDVECGNAAGTATCLIAGGGNEVGASSGPPAGAVPTFSVTRLPELTQFLQETAPTAANLEAIAAAGEAAAAGAEALAASSRSSSSRTADALSSLDGVDPSSIDLLGWSLRSLGSMSSTDEDDDAAAAGILGGLPLDPNTPGAPAPGLDFFDFLVEQGAIKTATTSFPRMGAAAGGLQACPQGGGDSLVHIGCGDGALTKMLASKGLRVWGVDADVTAASRRGLTCATFQGQPLSQGSLGGAAAAAGGAVDAVLVYTPAGAAAQQQQLGSRECLQPQSLREFGTLLKRGGRLCLEVPLSDGADAAAVLTDLLQCLPSAGYAGASCVQVLPGAVLGGQERLRVVAEWAG